MTKIGFLIPEFPGQTHAFFIREREELAARGVQAKLISTRKPIHASGNAKHAWAREAQAETTYLFPLSFASAITCVGIVVLAGPFRWWRILGVIFSPSDMTLRDRIKLFPLVLIGAQLKRISKQHGFCHIHVHSCASSANIALLARLLGGPEYSLTLHGPMQDYGSNQGRKWGLASFGIVITRELMAEIRSQLEGVELPPLSIAPMGVNIEKFMRTNAYQAPHSGQTVRLVSCGRLNFVKAHDDLIRTVALLNHRGLRAQLRICGATDSLSESEGYSTVLTDLCKELGVEEQVEFLGSVSEEAVIHELESAHIFCLASLKEPLGVAIMEAMAMELPCVVARSPGTAELVESGTDGLLVSPRAPEEFADAIVSLVDNEVFALTLGQSGRGKIVEHFHSGVSAQVIASQVNASD